VLLLSVSCVLAVRLELTKKPTTSMGRAFHSIDNNLIGLINCAARRSLKSPSFIEETQCSTAPTVTAQVPSQNANAAPAAAAVVVDSSVTDPSNCAQSATIPASSASAVKVEVTSKEVAEYFESVNGGKPVKGDGIMQLCKHAGGPFAGVFGKIRKAATGLAAAIQGLLPLFKAHDHDQADEAEQPAPAAAAFVETSSSSSSARHPTPAQLASVPTATTVLPVAVQGGNQVPAATTITTVATSSRHRIRFDREHKPISEAVCDFLVRHVDDLSAVCPTAADDYDGSKIVSGLLGHALAVALRG